MSSKITYLSWPFFQISSLFLHIHCDDTSACLHTFEISFFLSASTTPKVLRAYQTVGPAKPLYRTSIAKHHALYRRCWQSVTSCYQFAFFFSCASSILKFLPAGLSVPARLSVQFPMTIIPYLIRAMLLLFLLENPYVAGNLQETASLLLQLGKHGLLFLFILHNVNESDAILYLFLLPPDDVQPRCYCCHYYVFICVYHVSVPLDMVKTCNISKFCIICGFYYVDTDVCKGNFLFQLTSICIMYQLTF